jgi:uncharacterized SAM-binding protein YcdF (DUF218 family)
LTFRRRARRLLILLALGVVAAAFLLAGVIVDHSDTLAPADAIYILGGSRASRALEASELYAAGLAPHIVISQGSREPAEDELAKRNIHVPSEGEVARDLLVDHLAVPATAVALLPESLDNTAQEAAAFRRFNEGHHWTRLIAITDCAATRRAGFVLRRLLGPGVTVMARCSRTDGYEPWMWWDSRPTFRQTFYELPKLVAYWCGLRG